MTAHKAARRTGASRARLLSTAVAVVAAALALAACGSSTSNTKNQATASLGTDVYGTLPPTGTPTKGGVITMAQLIGQTPTYIFPVTPSANVTTGTVSLQSNMYMPLYAGPTGAVPKVDYALSFASGPPQPSDNDKTYTIPLKTGLKWSNGAPMDANDVLFEYYMLRAAVTASPANWGQYSPEEFPLSVTSASAPNNHTVVFHLDKSYNPGFFLNNQLADTNQVFPLPSTAWNVASEGGPHLTDWQSPSVAKKIYEYLNKAGASVSTFASNALWKDVSGPFELKSFSATNSSYDLVPNPSYGGSPKPAYSELQMDTFTGFTSELDAVKGGTLDVAPGIDPSQLAEAPGLKSEGIDIYGGPAFGWFGGIINFEDKADHFNKVIAQEYVREAIDHLIDQPAIIKGVYKGAAVEAYGPVPTAPSSPYTPSDALKAPYPYSPSTAVSLLRSHGWKVVPNGQTTCEKAGTATDECGAGIPAGTPLAFTWANQPSSVQTTGALESEAIASEAKKFAGIDISLQTKSFNFLTSEYNDQNPAAVKYTNAWGVNNYGGVFEDYYPTQNGIDNPHGGLNLGEYNNAKASELIEKSVFSENPSAVKEEASYLTKNPPVFYMPDEDYLIAVNTKKVAGPPAAWTVLTQRQWFPQFFYAVKSS